MIPTKRARRVVAVLAVPAFLLSAACGSEDSGSSDEPSEESSSPAGLVGSVSGEADEKPQVEIGADAAIGPEPASEVLIEGDGPTVQAGDFVRVDAVGKVAGIDQELVNTWPEEAAEPDAPHSQLIIQVGEDTMLTAGTTAPLAGATVGSRVQVEGQAEDMLGPQAAQTGLALDEGVVWVFDIVGAGTVDPRAAAEGEQAAPAEGMPEVEAGDQAPATVTIPEGDPPAELREQVLIEGDGPEITAGQGLIAQYTGVLWDTGEKFDSSWDRESASDFQIGTGSVVEGWDQGLVGKHVGDRVLLVIPPDLGYGEEAAGGGAIPGGSTLVFVVDIIGAV